MGYKFIVFDWNGTLSNAQVPADSLDVIPPLYEGAADVLKTLKDAGYLLGIATAQSRHALDIELDHHGIKALFTEYRCAGECLCKPDPAALNEMIFLTESTPEAVLMVGDTERDMYMAYQADVDGLAAIYGLQSKEELAQMNPVDFLDDIRDLPRWLQEHPKCTD